MLSRDRWMPGSRGRRQGRSRGCRLRHTTPGRRVRRGGVAPALRQRPRAIQDSSALRRSRGLPDDARGKRRKGSARQAARNGAAPSNGMRLQRAREPGQMPPKTRPNFWHRRSTQPISLPTMSAGWLGDSVAWVRIRSGRTTKSVMRRSSLAISVFKSSNSVGVHQLFFDEWASGLRKRLKGFFSRNGRDEPVVVPRLLGFGGLFHLEQIHVVDHPAILADTPVMGK